MKAGADGAQRHVQGQGDLGVLEIAPRPEQERLALVGGQTGQRGGELWAKELVLERAVGVAATRTVGERTSTRERPIAAAPVTEVTLEQLDGDPVEPGPGVLVSRLIAAPLVEGHAERLGGQILARLPGPRAAERVQRRPVAIKELLEGVGIVPGPRDDRGIGARVGVSSWR